MLFDELDRAEVRYCHWKSNIRLHKSLSGDEDIDLLVHPSDADAFIGVINRCGFKMAVSHMGAGHAGVFHAVAIDPQSGTLLDLHAYHQLISGDSFVKSFRFPVEDDLLARSTRMLGVRTADPTCELLLFLVRILLKHTSIIEVIKVNKQYEESREELAWLLRRADLLEAEALRKKWFPLARVSVDKMVTCVASGSLSARVVMGRALGKALRDQRRLGPVAGFLSRVIRVARHYAVRSRGRRNLSLLSGGAWIALVGPKGTGKSTLSALLSDRLGKNLDVEMIHLGKPPPTWLSFLPRMFLPAMRRAVPIEHLSEYEEPERRAKRRYSNVFVIGKLLVAFDRQRLLRRAMRAVASGTIVVSDRCPTTNSTGLDGSAFDDQAVKLARSRLQCWMMNHERAIYQRLPTPRIVLKLGAPLETALFRDSSRSKPGGPDPLAVQRRWKLESEAEYARSVVFPIDTESDVDSSLRAALACVWKSI